METMVSSSSSQSRSSFSSPSSSPFSSTPATRFSFGSAPSFGSTNPSNPFSVSAPSTPPPPMFGVPLSSSSSSSSAAPSSPSGFSNTSPSSPPFSITSKGGRRFTISSGSSSTPSLSPSTATAPSPALFATTTATATTVQPSTPPTRPTSLFLFQTSASTASSAIAVTSSAPATMSGMAAAKTAASTLFPNLAVPSTATAASITSDIRAGSYREASSTVALPPPQAPKPPSEGTGKTVEEVIKRWNAELQEHAEIFRKQANVIAAWDRRFLQNRDSIIRLEADVAKFVEIQSNLERQLELIETHQQEIDKALKSMEEEVEHIYENEHGFILGDEVGAARDAMHEQTEFITRDMEQMAEQIKMII